MNLSFPGREDVSETLLAKTIMNPEVDDDWTGGMDRPHSFSLCGGDLYLPAGHPALNHTAFLELCLCASSSYQALLEQCND